MEVAWFMHCHPGYGNMLVGVWPTKIGAYVRSWVDGSSAVLFYPMQPATRIVETIAIYSSSVSEDQIAADVLADFRARSEDTR